LHYIDRLSGSGSGENELARNAPFMLSPLSDCWPLSMAAYGCERKSQGQESPKPIRPHRPEGPDNLQRRAEWFQRRTSKVSANDC